MAKVSLSGATYVQRGYGQVEPNHLSAQRTGQIYAQLPAASTIDKLENGMFVKYDMQAGVCNFTGKGEWMLVYNEVKTYRDFESYEDFAMLKENYNGRVYSPVGQTGSTMTYPANMPTGTTMVPRVFKTDVGDIFTTNCVKEATLKLGDELAPGADGYLAKAGTDATMKFNVVKVYTLADGQPAVKLMRIA